MAATRQGCGKRQLQGKWHLNESAWAVKLFARLTELWSSDVCHTCAISRHFLLAQKPQKNHWTSWHCPFKTCRWWSWFCFSKRISFVKVSLSGHGPSAANEKNSVRRQFALLPWTKKKNHHQDSRRKERCSTCDIMLDQARLAQGKSDPRDCPRLLPCADRAWSSMISHVEQCSSRRESRGWFFFCLSRVVATKNNGESCPLLDALVRRVRRSVDWQKRTSGKFSLCTFWLKFETVVYSMFCFKFVVSALPARTSLVSLGSHLSLVYLHTVFVGVGHSLIQNSSTTAGIFLFYNKIPFSIQPSFYFQSYGRHLASAVCKFCK